MKGKQTPLKTSILRHLLAHAVQIVINTWTDCFLKAPLLMVVDCVSPTSLLTREGSDPPTPLQCDLQNTNTKRVHLKTASGL